MWSCEGIYYPDFATLFHTKFNSKDSKRHITAKELDNFFLLYNNGILYYNFWNKASQSELIPFPYIERTWYYSHFYWNSARFPYRNNLTIFDVEFILSKLSPFDTYCNVKTRNKLAKIKITSREELARERNKDIKAELEWIPKGNFIRLPEFYGIAYEKWYKEAEQLIEELIT